MKKYLNKNIFFQGDGKIFILLSSLLVVLELLLEVYINNNYANDYTWVIYDYSHTVYNLTPLGTMGVMLLGVFLIICFIIICGMFKRKKWATLLSGPFSKMDIRKREVALMIGCIIGFILMFLLVCIRYSIANDVFISYIKGYWLLVGVDVIRIIVIGSAITAVLFCIDSITSNIYVTLCSIFSIGAYIVAIMGTVSNSFIREYSYEMTKINKFLSNMFDSVLVGNEYFIYSYEFLIGLIIILLLTVIFGFIAKKLTAKLKVEHMGEPLVFKSTRKVLPFLISTFIGMTSGNIIFSNLLWSGDLEVYLDTITYPMFSLGIIIAVSIVAYIIIKLVMKALKNKIPKKYI